MDWKRLVEEIRSTGMSQSRIGEEVGRAQTWVADICSGRYIDVKWTDGQKLIALHKRVMSPSVGNSQLPANA